MNETTFFSDWQVVIGYYRRWVMLMAVNQATGIITDVNR